MVPHSNNTVIHKGSGILLSSIVHPNHPLVRLAHLIDWSYLEEQNARYYHAHMGRPGVSGRLMIGCYFLKYMYSLSDESVCERWVENP